MRTTPLLLSLALLAIPAHGQDAKDTTTENPEWKKLQASAEAFVKAFNDQDAATIASLVTEEAELIRDDGARIAGRPAIQAHYEAIFEEVPDAKVALEATAVRFLTPRLAVEEGALHVTDTADGEPASFLYTCLHSRQDDGSWLIAQSRSNQVADLAAHEALADVDGLVGDWIAQTEAGSLSLGFSWDDSGSYLLGKAVYRAAGLEPTTVSMRIGWDSVRERIVSWTFDAKGGFSKAEWTDTEDSWVVKASGYTGEGELTSSTQILRPTSQDSFTWSVTDKIIGGEVQSERRLHMVRRPPQPKLPNK